MQKIFINNQSLNLDKLGINISITITLSNLMLNNLFIICFNLFITTLFKI